MRFCILEHWQIGSIHWDLLLQQPFRPLRTWRLLEPPPTAGWAPAILCVPHREVYLVYEGPILSMRGAVRRWDRGTFRLQCNEPDRVILLANGARLNGRFELQQTPKAPDAWRFRVELAPTG